MSSIATYFTLLAAAVIVSSASLIAAPARSESATEPAAPAAVDSPDSLAAALNLTPKQTEAYEAYIAAIKQNAGAKIAGPSADQFRAMSMPDRLDYIAGRVAADLKLAQDEARAARHLYDLLSADQRKAFDEATAPATHEQLASVVSQPRRDTPDYSLPSHTNPDWLVRPTTEVIARAYPSRASAMGVGGRAILTCTVDVDGYLTDCVVDSETPPDHGFGNAALEITAYMRFLPMTDYGVPRPSKVTVPINFAPNEAAARTSTPAK